MANNNIEHVYSLTPMQEGMLYHKLVDEQSTGYVLQTELRMLGELKIEEVTRKSLFVGRKI